MFTRQAKLVQLGSNILLLFLVVCCKIIETFPFLLTSVQEDSDNNSITHQQMHTHIYIYII